MSLTEERRAELDRLARGRLYTGSVGDRAQVVAWWDDGYTTGEIADMAGISRPTVRKWVKRFQAEGAPGLDDRPKPGRDRWAPVGVRGRIALLTRQGPPTDTGLSHWSSRQLARQLRTEGYTVSHAFVCQVWRDLDLKPHRQGTHKVPRDPEFEAKVTAVCGLYLDPPDNAVVLSVDEKTQIQALDRTAPLLPVSFGHAEQRTADYVRHGTTNLFAAFDTATGHVTAECRPRRTGDDFLAFMDKVVAGRAGQDVHVIMDNLSTHRGEKVDAWLAEHPHVTFHYTPVGCSWLNQVETWFNIITKQSIRRGTFVSVPHLIKTIKDFIGHWNEQCHPFQWTATASDIIGQVNDLQRELDSILANNGRKATSITKHYCDPRVQRLPDQIQSEPVSAWYAKPAGRNVGEIVTSLLAYRQLELTPWSELRSGGGYTSQVGRDIKTLLFAEEHAAGGAYERLENEVESQGHLFECAPAVVSVIVAAVAEQAIPAGNLASCLDVLGRIVAGHSAESEVKFGCPNLGEECQREALKGYWSLIWVVQTKDPFGAWRVAQEIVDMLDEKHSREFLAASRIAETSPDT